MRGPAVSGSLQAALLCLCSGQGCGYPAAGVRPPAHLHAPPLCLSRVTAGSAPPRLCLSSRRAQPGSTMAAGTTLPPSSQKASCSWCLWCLPAGLPASQLRAAEPAERGSSMAPAAEALAMTDPLMAHPASWNPMRAYVQRPWRRRRSWQSLACWRACTTAVRWRLWCRAAWARRQRSPCERLPSAWANKMLPLSVRIVRLREASCSAK